MKNTFFFHLIIVIFRPWKLLAVLGDAARLPVPLVPALAAQIIDKKQTSTLIRYNLLLSCIRGGGIFLFFGLFDLIISVFLNITLILIGWACINTSTVFYLLLALFMLNKNTLLILNLIGFISIL